MKRPDWKLPLELAHRAALDWLEPLPERAVGPEASYAEMLARFMGPLPAAGEDAAAVIDDLTRHAPPGLMAMNHGRFFGWVIGGAMPVGVAADWLVSAWDQNTGMADITPSTSAIETVTAHWLLELLDLPRESSVGFVTGGQTANLVCLAVARDRVLRDAGWDVASDGLIGAPPLRILVPEHVHHSVGKALRILGLGDRTTVAIPCDESARVRPDALSDLLEASDGPVIVTSQAGEINTGALDPFGPICDLVATYRKRHPIWLHVDGAIGLWGRAAPSVSPRLAHLERADSWSTDPHKWLNSPFDCGVAIVSDADTHRRAMGLRAGYLPDGAGVRNPIDFNPEMSRRARSLPVYATLRALGRAGVADLVERNCALARRMAAGIEAIDGGEVLNEVHLNQVLVRFRDPDGQDDDAHTAAILSRVQQSGVAYPTATRWQDRGAFRISVCNWTTDDDDVDKTIETLAAAAAQARLPPAQP